MLKHILFDLDGTLTDPRQGLVRSVLHGLECMGRPLPNEADLNFIIGPPIQHSLRTLLQTDDENEVSRCLSYFRERYSEIGLFENEVYSGIPEALRDLINHGFDLYVATSKPKLFADRILERFELASFFKCIYGSRLDGTRIEKYEVIEDVLAGESISPDDALMIGDREHDVLGAKKNGIPCIGVLYGYGSRNELLQAGATDVCESPSTLVQLILDQHSGNLATAID